MDAADATLYGQRMSGKVVNLNKARKAKSRATSRKQADANAVKFGRTKAEKSAVDLRSRKDARDLDGKKRE